MISNEIHNGWGAYQNKKKEIETLKKQLIVQDINKFGDVITLNKNNDFENAKIKVNPFRFPNKITNEELQKDNNVILNDDELSSYKTKLIEYSKYISENNKIIKNIQDDFEEQTNKLKIEYENKLLEQKNKYNKWCLIVSGLTELINDFNNNMEPPKTNIISIQINEIEKNKTNEDTILPKVGEISSVEVEDNNCVEVEDNNFVKVEDKNGEIQPQSIISNKSNRGRKKSTVSEKRLIEGDTETCCIVEIDDIIYHVYYEYTSYFDTQIFMSKCSIVKHKGNIIDVTFDKIKNRFIFYINNKLVQISYKRPRTNMIKNVFQSNTIIRHKAVNEEHTWYERDKKGQAPVQGGTSGVLYLTFDEYCIYVKTKNKFYKCDVNGNGNYSSEDEYKTLSQFIIDNYVKRVPYYGYCNTCRNQFEYLEYFCKKENSFKPFKDIWHDTKIN
jgi:hypothetical protein